MPMPDIQILYCNKCLKVTQNVVLWYKTDEKCGIHFYCDNCIWNEGYRIFI